MSKKIIENIIISIIFGGLYCLLEIIYRCHTDLSMGILGAICGLFLGLLDEFFPKMKIIHQMLIGTIFITILEFLFGYVLNIKLGLNIWDYSNVPFNLYGQICLPFSFIWFLLSYIAIKLDNYLRNKL